MTKSRKTKGAIHIDTKLALIKMDDGEELPMDFSRAKNPVGEMWKVVAMVNNMESYDMGKYRTHQVKEQGMLYITKICH